MAMKLIPNYPLAVLNEYKAAVRETRAEAGTGGSRLRQDAAMGEQAEQDAAGRHNRWQLRVLGGRRQPCRTGSIKLAPGPQPVEVMQIGWEHRLTLGLLPMTVEALRQKGYAVREDKQLSLEDVVSDKHDYFLVRSSKHEIASLQAAEMESLNKAFLSRRTPMVPYLYQGEARWHRLDHVLDYLPGRSKQIARTFRLAFTGLNTIHDYNALILHGMAGLPADAPVRQLMAQREAGACRRPGHER